MIYFLKKGFRKAKRIIKRMKYEKNMLKKEIIYFISKTYCSIYEYIVFYRVPKAKLIKEVNLGRHGGCKLIVADNPQIENQQLFFWLQTEGMFKSNVHNASTKAYKEKSGQKEVFCLTATNSSGTINWQIGEPFDGEMPYLSHAAEQMMTLGDINGDGINEILVLDGKDQLLVVSLSGEVLRRVKLPNDSFSQVYYTKTGSDDDFIIIIGVMDRAYCPHPYANPWLFINSNFEIIHSGDYLGAGHNILIDDINKDGKPEILIGYQLVNLQGQILWTLDCWKGKEINDLEQHADNIQGQWIEGSWYGTISGSDKQYFFNSEGQCIWIKDLPHPQCCLFGRYNNEHRIFVANQREIMNIFDLDGEELWRSLLPEHWPMGKPKLINPKRPIHTSNPIDGFLDTVSDLILYKEGGWPYMIDFSGNLCFKFPINENMKFDNNTNLYRRINDIGVSFEAEIYDVDIDGSCEIIIYNRKFFWIFKTNII